MTGPRFDPAEVRASLKIGTKAAVLAYVRQTGLLPSQAAGLRSIAVRRSTGTLVGVYQAQEAGLEDDADAGRYATVCEPHSRLVLHDTRQLAEDHATCPEGWCGVCSGSELADDEQVA